MFNATYSVGDFLFNTRWSYTPKLTSGSFGNELPEASYVDFSTRWNVNDRLQLTGIIGNVFDEEAPQITEGTLGGQANTDVQVYRVLGRTFQVQARLRF